MSFDTVSNVLSAVLFLSLFCRSFEFSRDVYRAVCSMGGRMGVFCASPRSAFRLLNELRHFVIDVSWSEPAGQYTIDSMTVLDERVSEKGVFSALMSLLAPSDKRFHRDLCRSAETKCGECVVEQVSEWRMLDNEGLSGVIQGVRFSMGPEEVLLGQGVHFEVSDAGATEDRTEDTVFFLGCGNLPIARFDVRQPLFSEGRQLHQQLLERRIRLFLMGEEDSNALDAAGRKIGLELASISGGLTADAFKERILALEPAGLLKHSATPPEAAAAASMRAACFDHRKWKFDEADVVFFHHSLGGILDALNLAALERGTRRILLGGASILSLVLFLLSVSLIIPPAAVLSVILLWSLVQTAVVFRLTSYRPVPRPLSNGHFVSTRS